MTNDRSQSTTTPASASAIAGATTRSSGSRTGALVGRYQPGHRARHAAREAADLVAAVDDVGPGVGVVAHGADRASNMSGRAAAGARGPWSTVRNDPPLRRPRGQVPVARETRVVGLDDERGERARDARVDRVAARLQHVERRRHLVGVSGGDALPA